jgi:hypothetical protein
MITRRRSLKMLAGALPACGLLAGCGPRELGRYRLS